MVEIYDLLIFAYEAQRIKHVELKLVSVDLRVNRISAISGHLPRLEGRRMRRGASGTPVCACLPNEGDAQRWRLIRQTLIYLQPLRFTDL